MTTTPDALPPFAYSPITDREPVRWPGGAKVEVDHGGALEADEFVGDGVLHRGYGVNRGLEMAEEHRTALPSEGPAVHREPHE